MLGRPGMPAAGRSSNLGFQAIRKIATTCASIQFSLAYIYLRLYSRVALGLAITAAPEEGGGPRHLTQSLSASGWGKNMREAVSRATRVADLPRARSPGGRRYRHVPGQPTGRTGRSGALRGFFDVKVRGIGTHTGEIHREPEPNGRRAKLSMVPRLSHRGRSHGDEY